MKSTPLRCLILLAVLSTTLVFYPGLLSLSLHGQSVEQGKGSKPNIVIIYADDLGYGDFSCYGATAFATPHCDRIAEQGMLFTDAHSPSAVCTPSRYALLTGRYAWRTWMKNWIVLPHMPLLVETNRLTLPGMLQNEGYTTGCVGKWHLGWGSERNPDFSQVLKPGPLEIGFDRFFGVPFSHNSPKHLRNYIRDRRIVGLKEGEDIHDPAIQNRVMRSLENTATELSAEAVSFIHQNRDRPFFLYYPTTNIHVPHTPHPRFAGQGQAGNYGEFVLEFDWAVGEITRTLDELGLTRNTLLIVTSDNGGRPSKDMGAHRPNGSWRGRKAEIYEGGHRVPMLVRWPGVVAPGSVSDETVCHTDLLATIADYLNVTVPENAGEDSYNLMPILRGQKMKQPLREATVHHSVTGMFAIRQGDWKLIEGETAGGFASGSTQKAEQLAQEWPAMDPVTRSWKAFTYPIHDYDTKNPVYRLYNLKDDPGETTDLAADHPGQVKALTALLNRYRESGKSVPLK